jgi:DNA-binding NarL/FixJ family response regulator
MRIDVTWSREGPSGSQLRVIVADDDVLLRAGMANLLERSGIAVAGQAGGVDVDEFTQTLDRVARGGAVIDPALEHELAPARRRDDPLAVLGPRERKVLVLMAEGRPNTGIAPQLWVTEGTVEKHVQSISPSLRCPRLR